MEALRDERASRASHLVVRMLGTQVERVGPTVRPAGSANSGRARRPARAAPTAPRASSVSTPAGTGHRVRAARAHSMRPSRSTTTASRDRRAAACRPPVSRRRSRAAAAARPGSAWNARGHRDLPAAPASRRTAAPRARLLVWRRSARGSDRCRTRRPSRTGVSAQVERFEVVGPASCLPTSRERVVAEREPGRPGARQPRRAEVAGKIGVAIAMADRVEVGPKTMRGGSGEVGGLVRRGGPRGSAAPRARRSRPVRTDAEPAAES